MNIRRIGDAVDGPLRFLWCAIRMRPVVEVFLSRALRRVCRWKDAVLRVRHRRIPLLRLYQLPMKSQPMQESARWPLGRNRLAAGKEPPAGGAAPGPARTLAISSTLNCCAARFRVPDMFQLGAILSGSAFLACRKINNLRVFNTPEYSDSPPASILNHMYFQ